VVDVLLVAVLARAANDCRARGFAGASTDVPMLPVYCPGFSASKHLTLVL